jgi:hypothetical protein
MKKWLAICIFFAIFTGWACHSDSEKIKIVTFSDGTSRIDFGAERLNRALTRAGYAVEPSSPEQMDEKTPVIVIGSIKDAEYKEFIKTKPFVLTEEKEGFTLKKDGNTIYVSGADPSGALYGCMELAGQIEKAKKIPKSPDMTDKPEMIMRGTCIGLQKPVYLPGRKVYEYPYTPESFPWFYDKELWIKYLDMMVENRYNTLYLWNGHPFASLVKLPDYPYAVEVDEPTFKKNEELFSFLTAEADKRGIWVIQMFYNIIVSKPFAEHHHISTQDRNRPIIPVIADYTRKSVAAFIEKYPQVGLLVTLGEAMNTIEDDVSWFTETIIPGVKDGLQALGRTDEPPIVLRAHDTDGKKVMDAALPLYKNLYTMSKYNGESLTTYNPRESWDSIPKMLSRLGSVHISNVHILANLEPFRYGSPDFIRKSVIAMKNIQGAGGLHLYPQASYWDWPYTADKTEPRTLEMERDRIWYQAWARYAWNKDRDRNKEIQYWTDELNEFYGCKGGRNILTAYEETGEIAPKLLRTFGISDGNRQSLLLGMFMGQLVNPYKYQVYSNFWSSSGPLKEVLLEYAEKEFKGEKHVGETPPQVISEVVAHGAAAVEAIDKIPESSIKAHKEEFLRLKNDIRCYDVFGRFFAEKVKAAMLVLHYKYTDDIADLEAAIPFLENSVVYFKQLVDLTKDAYLYANSMQTQQRRIPISGLDGKNKTWEELLPHYELELENFKRNLTMLKAGAKTAEEQILKPVDVTILNKDVKIVALRPGTSLYADRPSEIEKVTPGLQQLKSLQLTEKMQSREGTVLKFKTDRAVKVLVGYFNTNSHSVVQPPALETNANANDRGQSDIKIANALNINKLYPVNVYTYLYEAGEHALNLGKGLVLVLGFIDGSTEISTYDAGMGSDGNKTVDWLFY